MYKSQINLVEIKGKKPRPRSFHSADLYKDKYIILYGGLIEDDIETNEIWLFDVNKKEFFEYENKENLKSKEIYFIYKIYIIK